MRTRRSTLAILLAMVLLAACSERTIQRHSYAAQTLEDLSAKSRVVVLQLRRNYLEEAKAAAVRDGVDVRVAVLAAAEEFDHGSYLVAVNAFIEAKDVYVRSVLMAAGVDDPDFVNLRRILRGAISAYDDLCGLLPTLPRLPHAVREI